MAHNLIQRRDLKQSLSAKMGTRLGDKRTGSSDETRASVQHTEREKLNDERRETACW
jgi:hypothetical protein